MMPRLARTAALLLCSLTVLLLPCTTILIPVPLALARPVDGDDASSSGETAAGEGSADDTTCVRDPPEGARGDAAAVGRECRHPNDGGRGAAFTVVSDDRVLLHHHVEATRSTQDEARSLLRRQEFDGEGPRRCIAVSATRQSHGRGTSGRIWMGGGGSGGSKEGAGNAFVTVAVPSSSVPSGVPHTLLPLKVGSVTAGRVVQALRECGGAGTRPGASGGGSSEGAEGSSSTSAKVALKWPNDVLLDGGKVGGILIESTPVNYSRDGVTATTETWYLIGVGINVLHAPDVDLSGPNRGRRAACVWDRCPTVSAGGGRANAAAAEVEAEAAARDLGERIARDVAAWMALASRDGSDPAAGAAGGEEDGGGAILREWEAWVEWGKEHLLRDSPEEDPSPVVPVGIESDGRLRVRQRDGRERLLAAEYLL